MTLGREKINFLNTPTPLQRLDNISVDLGMEIYIKRDDLTDFGTGGNKLRKLEYFVKDARDKGATMLLTVGGAQTNHGRLTAAVAAKYGMKAAIIAVDEYPGELSANLLLDGILGCPVYLVQRDGEHSAGKLQAMAIEKVTKEWEDKGEKVYFIPMGGSNELGILGYYDCALETVTQSNQMGLKNVHMVTTVGSMGTYMGLAAAIKNENLPMKLTGIGIMPYKNGLQSFAKDYYDKVKAAFRLDAEMTEADFNLTSDYDRGGYNNPVREVRDAIYYMARKEAIILDPCYTGKAFAGLLAMIREGNMDRDETIIFLHTGGVPGIYTKHHRLEMEKELEEYIHIL